MLINVPRLSRPGGVANYYKILRALLGPDCEYFEVGGKTGADGKFRALKRIIIDFFRFYRAVGADDIDLAHLNPSLGPKSLIRDGIFLMLAKIRGKKVIVFFRGWDKAFEKVIRSRYSGLFQLIYGKSDAFIVLAEEFRESLQSMGISGPIWLDTTVVADSVIDQEIVNDRSQTEYLSILYMSRIEPGKGCDLVINAYARFLEMGGRGRLVIAGDGGLKAEMQNLVDQQNLPEVHFPGYLSGQEKNSTYLAADLFFYPTSYGEGMPNSVLEAMGYGLPVITRPVAGLKDFFVNGKMGFSDTSEDPEVFADFLQLLANDPNKRQQIGRDNRAYAAKRFAASQVVARLKEYYRQALEG